MFNDKEKSAEKLTFFKLFFFFLLGSIIGSFYEEILFFFQFKEWTRRHDLLYGPFSTLYGFGLIIFLLLLGNKNKNRSIIKTFFYSSLIGGVTEYIAGFLSEIIFHIRFWDYSSLFLNIHGRTTVPFMFAWGFMATLFLKIIYPFLSKYFEKIPIKIKKILFYFCFLLIFIDMFLSYTVFIRMVLRNQGKSPKTFVGEFYDQIYTDEYMYNKFPILLGKFKK